MKYINKYESEILFFTLITNLLIYAIVLKLLNSREVFLWRILFYVICISIRDILIFEKLIKFYTSDICIKNFFIKLIAFEIYLMWSWKFRSIFLYKIRIIINRITLFF